MNCILKPAEQEELLLDYCSGRLAPDAAAAYARHIATCEHCNAMVELHQTLDDTLDDFAAPAASPNFDSQLFARIRAEQPSRPQAWWREWFTLELGWKPMVPVALAALVLGVVLLRPTDPAITAQHSDTIRAEEIEQVERALDDMEALQAIHQAATQENESL